MIPTTDLVNALISRCANQFTVDRDLKLMCSFFTATHDEVEFFFMDEERPGAGFKRVILSRDSIAYLITSRDCMVWQSGNAVQLARWVW